MNKLKSIQDLATEFLNYLGEDFTVDVNEGEDMCAYHYVDIIQFDVNYYLPEYYPNFKNKLVEYNKSCGFDMDIHIATFGFLHEIGHLIAAQTYEDLDEELVANQFLADRIDADDVISYKNLKMEKDADYTAYDLYISHTEEIKKLDRAICRIMGV